MSLHTYLRAVPKAELHVHLEGSIQPPTLLTLARRNGVSLPADDEAALRRWFTFRDFEHFVEVYVAITQCLRTVEDYELVTHQFGAEMARQNIRYAEVTFTPETHRKSGVPRATFMEGLSRGRERVGRDFGAEINWIFDMDRFGGCDDATVDVAIDGRDVGVVALGLGGPEAGHPPEPFEGCFRRARAHGLHSVSHAGETSGAESVWGAIRAVGAERIGHGVRSIEDPALVAYLAEASIPLEVCPTSNLRLGIYPSLEEHPLRRLHDFGVIVTVNSDDPSLFNTTLNHEVLLLSEGFGLDLATIDEIILNGVRCSFLPPERKSALEIQFRQEMAALKASYPYR